MLARSLRLERARDPVEAGLLEAWDSLCLGPPEPYSIAGQLLRPRLGYSAAGARRVESLGRRFWLSQLAIQLAHDASLLHDDVVDGSEVRRGRPTLLRQHGVGAALVAGDQLLARAYLAAAATENWAFVHRFTRAVDATISGERAQGRAVGVPLGDAEMRAIARGKSGQLFACSFSAAAALEGSSEADERAQLGEAIGVFYQRVDDLLDYCPGAATGKPPLADFDGKLWTWPRRFLDSGSGPQDLFREGEKGRIPALRALDELEREGQGLIREVERSLPDAQEVRDAVRGWLRKAGNAVRREVRASVPTHPGTRPLVSVRSEPPSGSDPVAILAKHGKSFHFASRLMPPEVRGPVARVYAFCRTVDDAVDLAPDLEVARRALGSLLEEARAAYSSGGPVDGRTIAWTGPTADRATDAARGPAEYLTLAMAEMRGAEVSFELVEKLIEGVGMDLEPRRFADFDDLSTYTHRVAGVVGIWMAGLAGCRDPWALSLADELGRAMQLTNIARDVGEDLEMGRLYLPLDLLERHRLGEDQLLGIRSGAGAIPAGFAAALEEVMAQADAGYGAAIQAVPKLPEGYRGAVAVAARVYQGIHREIRRNGYDSLRRRARTGLVRKFTLGLSSLRELARAEARA
jgi:15-cis-phytoene synthase